jgi:hypothetical protein
MFEHKLLTFRGPFGDAEGKINELGAEGWAVVSSHSTDNAVSTVQTHHFVLRRDGSSRRKQS